MLGKSYLMPEASVIVSEGERSQGEIEMMKGGALTDRLTYLLTHSLTYSLTHSLVLTYLLTYSLTKMTIFPTLVCRLTSPIVLMKPYF